MYHLNPAVIKSILVSMSKKELEKELQYIRSQVEQLPVGNRRTMFLNLYLFVKSGQEKQQADGQLTIFTK